MSTKKNSANTVVAQPPRPTKKPKELMAHGQKRVDPYYWLRERENPEVKQYLREENAYLEKVLAPVRPLRETILKEMKARIKPQDQTVPEKIDDYFYYVRFELGQDYPIFCRRFKNMTASEQVILNVNELAKGKDVFRVANVHVSPDHRVLAYAVDEKGDNIFTLQFRDLDTNRFLPQKIEKTAGSYAWANDNRTLFFNRQDEETLRPDRVFRTNLDHVEKQDLVYHEKDTAFTVGIDKDKLKKYIYINSHSTLSAETRYVLADRPEGKFKIFLKRQPKHEYSVEFAGDRFFILTNRRAKNFKLVECPENKTDLKSWRTVIPVRADILIEGVEVFKDFVVVQEMEKGLAQIQVWSRSKRKSRYVDLPDSAYSADVYPLSEYETTKMRYTFESLRRPYSVFEYDMVAGQSKLLKEQEILGGFNKDNYETERVWAPAADGEKIPVSLLYRKGTNLTGQNPMLIEGYGAYGYSNPPHFRSEILSLIDRGFVFAIASIRGGSELGREWYEEGKLLKKKNSFFDFIAVTKFLQAKKWSSPLHTYATGRSAGGLLMGAVMNLRPDLYNGMVLGVPFVDVITTMMDESLPLTTLEYDEWGDPRKKKFYDYILSYSPYDQLAKAAYPNVLLMTGFNDAQVSYWEPAKFLAKLRDVKTDSHWSLMWTELEAGHGGKTGRYQSLDEDAMVAAFLLFLEGK